MKYDAFISYRHTPLDMEMAKKIHAGLETFKVPKAVQKSSEKKNIKRVFRDQEELPIGSDLNNNISSALENSEFLLVICSPDTPQSYWCAKEIDTFIEMHDQDHVLAVLIDGEPNQSFPPRLLSDKDGNPVEPLAADVRGATSSERKKKMKTELMRLAAPILGCSYDDLRQRHRERKIKRIMSFVTLGAAVLTILGISFGVYNAGIAKKMMLLNDEISKNYTAKQINQSKFLATTSSKLLREGNREDAVLVALQALPGGEEERPFVPDALYSLTNALYVYSDGSTLEVDGQMVHDLAVSDFSYNTDGTKIVSKDSGSNIYVWDYMAKELLVKIPAPISDNGYRESVKSYAMNEDTVYICYNTHLAAYGVDGSLIYSKPLDSSVSYASYYVEDDLGFLSFLSSVKVISLSDGETVSTVENPFEGNLSIYQAYCSDLKLYAENTSSLTDDASTIVLFDFSGTDVSARSVEATGGYVMRLGFTPSGNLCVISTGSSENLNKTRFDFNVDLFSPQGELLWTYTQEMSISNLMMFDSFIKAHTVVYDDHETKEIVVSLDNHMLTLDEDTGEVIASVNVSGAIRTIMLRRSEPYAYVAQAQGVVDFVNTATGQIYSDYATETECDITMMDIKNSTMTLKSYLSSVLTVLSYHTGPGVEQIAELEKDPMHAYSSMTGDILCFSSLSANGYYEFYNTDGTHLSTYTPENYSFIEFFLPDDLFLTVPYGREIVYYDPKTGETSREPFVLDEIGIDGESVSDNHEFICLWANETFIVYDLLNRKQICTKSLESDIVDAYVDDTGDCVILVTLKNGTIDYRVSEDSLTECSGPNLYALSDMVGKNIMDVSPDLRYAAIACADGFLRIVDLSTHEVTDSLDFLSQLHSFVYFTDDSRHIIMQGENYVLKIYDLEAKAVIGSYTENYSTISDIWEDTANHVVAIYDSFSVLLLETDTYSPIGIMWDGILYSEKENAIYAANRNTLLRTPVLSLEEVMEEAKNQYPNSFLSDEERNKYFID